MSALIDAAHVTSSDTVLEIGPGTGILTRALAKRAGSVVAIEKDETLARALARLLKTENITNVKILEGDVLKQIPPIPAPYKIVANIPYYLTGRLLRLLLEERKEKPSDIVVMIQKEVARRIVALPPHENLLGISVQAFGTPKIIKEVPASCFIPRPNVDSAIISISDISDDFFIENNITPQDFFRVARLGFSQKRKVLTTSLRPIADKKSIEKYLNILHLDPKSRPEQITIYQWAYLVARMIVHSPEKI